MLFTRGVEAIAAPYDLRCLRCQQTAVDPLPSFCDSCGAMIDVRYPLQRVSLHTSSNPYRRFAELLPIGDASLLPQSSQPTPTHHARRLGEHLKLPSLYLKNETVLPTGTTKDRMAAVSLAYLWERGIRTFTTSSTGNSSSSYATSIANFPDMRVLIFTAERFVARVSFVPSSQVVHFGLREATFVEAARCAERYARCHDLYFEPGFFNPGRREGLKLAFLEASEQVPTPIDWYVQAVSSAMGVFGAYKGARELLEMHRIDKLPRLLCVQQESCAPMVRGFEAGAPTLGPEHLVARPAGIAEAILRGDPTRAYPYVRQIVQDSGGSMASVSESQIREAQNLLQRLEGITACFASAAALAGAIKLTASGVLPRHDTILVNLTGRDRPPAASPIRWLRKHQDDWLEEA